MTLVPARKKVIRRAKGKLHGCTACAIAVSTAATIPAGVKDLCDQALYTIARVIGTAIYAFMLSDLSTKSLVVEKGLWLRGRLKWDPKLCLFYAGFSEVIA